MSSNLQTLSEFSRRILRLLFEGWDTVDDVKSEGTMRASEIAAALGAPLDETRAALLLLETTGYVLTQRLSAGGDPTLEYKRVDERDTPVDDADPVYLISAWGKQAIAAEEITPQAESGETARG